MNWKRLLIVAAALLTLSAATYGIHEVQVRRQASSLKDRARQASPDEAVELLARYIKIKPKDEEAYLNYAKLNLERAKGSSKIEDKRAAAASLDLLLRQFPEHSDERRKLIDLYLEMGNLESARQHLRILFDKGGDFKEDVDLLDKAATCEYGLGDVSKAVKFLDEAIQTHKAPPRIVERLLGILHNTKGYNDPRYTPAKYIGILVNQEPYRSDVEARIAAGRFLLSTGEAQNARRHITDALAMPKGSTNAEALMAAAELERSEIKGPETVQPQLKKERAYLENAHAIDKKNVRVGLRLARNLTDLGEKQKAIDVLKETAQELQETNDLMQMVVDRLIDLSELDLSRILIERIEKNEADRERIAKYFRGRIALVKQDFVTGRKLLEETAPLLVRLPEFHKRDMTGLGKCYAAIQNPDKQLEYFTAALKDDAYYLPALVGHADALYKLGRFREALAEYRTIVNGYGLALFRPAYARLEYRAAVKQPAVTRNWEAFEKSLGAEDKRTSELWVLYAESLLARGDLGKTASVLEAVLNKDPKFVPAWILLARISGRGQPGSAGQKLAEAAKALGDIVELRLARSLILVNRARKPTPAEFRALADGAENKFDKKQQHRLFTGLGEAASRAANFVEDPKELRNLAIEFMQKAARQDETDLIARATIIDLGIAAGRNDVVDVALKEIAKVEGETGPIGTLAQVVRRLPKVRKIEDKAARAAAIGELRVLAKRARTDRPGWGRVYVALAQLDELEGLNDSALNNFKEAIDKGERQEYVIRRAVELYRERRQDDQAALLLNSLHTEVKLPDDLERFRAIKDLLARDIPASEKPTIDRIAPASSKEWRILLLRGALLAAIGDDAEAQVAFRGAVALGDTVPETWGSLVSHLVRLNKMDDAKRATSQAERKIGAAKTDAANAELITSIASCHELIGDMKRAEELFRQAVRTAPRELNPNRQLLLFLQRHRSPEAVTLLKKLVDDPAQSIARWARRHYALTLMAQRDAYQQRQAAMDLIEQNIKVSPDDPEDVKAKAVVQTIDPATREEGMKTLKDFAKWGDLTPDEFLLLGRLHFEQGKVFESVDYFEQAAKMRAGVNAEHIAGLIRVYLGIGKLKSARQTLARLKNFSPRSWDATREEARILHAEALDAEKRGAAEEAKKLTLQAREAILNFPNAKSEQSIRQRTGPLLEELGYLPEVESYYSKLLSDGKEPNVHFPLAGFLIRQKRTAEAIELAKKYEATTPPALTARIFTSAIRAKSPGVAAEREAAAWLDKRLKNPATPLEKLSLVMSKAELFEGMTEYDRAIEAYQDAIALAKATRISDAKDFAPELIANNLAMLLALHHPEQADRAIKLMDNVIAIRGPAPVFLDTRAVCYIVKGGKTEEAARDLKLALIQQHRAVYLFHLAWAYDLNPNKRALREQKLDEAKKLGLKPEDLHPMEVRKFNEFYKK